MVDTAQRSTMRRVGGVLAALAACFCISQAHAAEPDAALAAALVLHAVDAGQTLHISESCRAGGEYYELNPVLGRCPTKAEVSRYFLGTAVLGTALHLALPESWAKYSTGLWITVGAGTTARNAAMGLRVRF